MESQAKNAYPKNVNWVKNFSGRSETMFVRLWKTNLKKLARIYYRDSTSNESLIP
jgi:hypothetical protein